MQRLMILPSFVKLERDEMEKDLTRCMDAISRETYHLDQLCGDWSAWDDTYQFVKDKNPDFLKANIDWPTLEKNSGLNLLMFYTLEGHLIWGEANSASKGGKIEISEFENPAPGTLHYLLAHESVESKITGLILTGHGPLLISSRPVLKTDGEGPFNAVILMGRLLDEQLLRTLADQTKVSFKIRNLCKTPLTPLEKQTLARLAPRKYVVDTADKDYVYGYGMLNDLQGKPALLLTASFSREIFKRGQATARLASWSVGSALALLVVLIALWFLLRLTESQRYTEQAEKLVTQRTAELHEAQKFLEAALAQSPVGILIADAPGVTIRLANAAARAICGGDRNLLTGIDVAQLTTRWQVFYPDGSPYPPEQFPLSRATLQGEVTQDEEILICDKEGKTHWVSTNAAPIRNDKGDITAGIAILHDITVRKRTEEELQKTQRLKSIGTLAGGIAHDFNNILMALYGNIALAKDELTQDHPAYQPLENAEKSMNRAIRLTRQLLTFARGGEPVKEDVSIGKVVEETAQFDLSGSNVVLDFKQEEKLWKAEADKGQVQQVISNLTTNAREAMPSGGHLYVILENAEIGEVSVPGLRQGKYIKMTVRDEGVGIERKCLDRIFDPYFSTKQAGSGLGLATTYSIINQHGGHISVTSELGKGTTFTLYLPASEEPQNKKAETPSATPLQPGHVAKILVVDDEEMLRTLVTKMLGKSGYFVETASGGKQAIAMYRQALEAGKPFDVVIMDLTLPGGIGGEEAIRDILAIDPNAKALVSSGYAVDPVMAHYDKYGFKGIVVKPYNQSELLNVLKRVLVSNADDIAH